MRTMDQLQAVSSIAVAISSIITGLISLVLPGGSSTPTPGTSSHRWRNAIIASVTTLVFGGIIVGILSYFQVPPFQTRSIDIKGGLGERGCVTDLSGSARVPSGEDAWIFLQNDIGDYTVQGIGGARPIVTGKASQDWTLPGVSVSDKFYPNARYSVVGIIVPLAESAVLRQKLGDGSRPLHADQFPQDALFTERKIIKLVSPAGCTG